MIYTQHVRDGVRRAGRARNQRCARFQTHQPFPENLGELAGKHQETIRRGQKGLRIPHS